MVLSGTKRTSSIASITNRSNGGGNKKAGLPRTVGGNSMWSQIALNGTSSNTSVLDGSAAAMAASEAPAPAAPASDPAPSA